MCLALGCRLDGNKVDHALLWMIEIGRIDPQQAARSSQRCQTDLQALGVSPNRCWLAIQAATNPWVILRSAKRSDVVVQLRQFLDPYEKHLDQIVRTTAEWKKFKLTVTATKDFAADLILQLSADASVDFADIVVNEEP